MKPWLVVALAACLPPNNAPPQPAPPPVTRVDPAARQRRATQHLADVYDALVDRLSRADGVANDDEVAATSYRDIAHDGEQLVARVEASQGGPYMTKHDGTIDGKTLVTNVRKVRARAAHRGDEAWLRFAEALERELHALSPAQRAALVEHGRPQVIQRDTQTCWVFSSDTFCWSATGELVTHEADTDAPEVASEDVVPADPRVPLPPPKPKKSIVYYAAATFASGRCIFSNCMTDGWETETPAGTVRTSCEFSDCAKNGWTSRHPDGRESRTRCEFSDCFKDGWETQHPDGTTSHTRCEFSDCMTDGWTTTNPDGSEARTRCEFSDCAKDGWDTTLSSGKTIHCRCEFSDCVKNGASCR